MPLGQLGSLPGKLADSFFPQGLAEVGLLQAPLSQSLPFREKMTSEPQNHV